MSEQKLTTERNHRIIDIVHRWTQLEEGLSSEFHYDYNHPGLFSVFVNGMVVEARIDSERKLIIFDKPPDPHSSILLALVEKVGSQ